MAEPEATDLGQVRAALQLLRSIREEPSAPLSGGGGGGTSGGMSDRVTRLESHMEYVRRDLDGLARGQSDLSSKLGAALLKLDQLPTRRDLDSWRVQWIAVGIAVVALIVTGVVGGLALINHYAAAGPVSPR